MIQSTKCDVCVYTPGDHMSRVIVCSCQLTWQPGPATLQRPRGPAGDADTLPAQHQGAAQVTLARVPAAL